MPLDFTGNDPNKFQDTIQYAPNDPRAAIAGAQANLAAVQAAAPTAIPEMPIRPEGGFTNAGDIRAYRSAMQAHNQALQSAKEYAETSKYMSDALHQAQIHADAGDFHSEFAHIPLDDPNITAKTTALLAKYPGAASDPSVQHSLSIKLDANAKHTALSMANAKEEEAHQQKASKIISEGLQDGSILASDLQWDPKSGALPKFIQRNVITGKPEYNTDYLEQLSGSRTAAGIGTKAARNDAAQRSEAMRQADYLKKSLADMDAGTPEYQSAQDQINELNKTIFAPVKKRAGVAQAAAVKPNPLGNKKPEDYFKF